jgi:predicted PurR-regulated permease PerM
MLNTIITGAESLGMKRTTAVVLLYLCLAGLLLGAEMAFFPVLEHEIRRFYAMIPELHGRLQDILNRTADAPYKYPLIAKLLRTMLGEAMKPIQALTKTLTSFEIFTQAAPFLHGIVLTPFFVFFLLKDWPGIVRRIMDRIPCRSVETTVSLICEINILVGNYSRGLAVDCISVGIIATFGLWLLGINYPILLGILSGAANVIPYFGPVMACGISCLFALLQFENINAVVNVILLYLVIRVLDDLVIQPFIVGKSVELHPMLLVITIIAGEKLLGILGMILAVPAVTMTQKVLTILIENRSTTTAKRILKRTEGQAIPL